MKKDTILRLTASEFLLIMMISVAAVETYDCHIVPIISLIVAALWWIIFFVANGVYS